MALVDRYSSMPFASCLLPQKGEWETSENPEYSLPDPLIDQIHFSRREFAVPPGVEVSI